MEEKMSRIKRFKVVCGLFACVVISTVQAQSAFRIEERMNADELQAAGLQNLDADQLQALNDWLQRNVIQQTTSSATMASETEATVRSEPDPGVAATPSEEQVETRRYGEREEYRDVVSMIRGQFSGWEGNTVFRLENGQVYQQRRPGRWKTSLTDPQVRVTRSFLGMLELEVEGHSIGVKRLE
jgi:hypothetical protein